MIDWKTFTGIIPRLDAEQLPENAAQRAHNCDLTSGVLVPAVHTGPFNAMHKEDGVLKSGIPADDVIQITKPTAPSVNNLEYICKPVVGGNTWMNIEARTYFCYIDDSGNWVYDNVVTKLLSLVTIRYDEVGMWMICSMSSFYKDLDYRDEPYYVYGPRYRFKFIADEWGQGGPEQAVNLPEVPSYGDSVLPGGFVPLLYGDHVYGQFQAWDVNGPTWRPTIKVINPDGERWYFPGVTAYVAFRIHLNYTYPTRRYYYFVQTMLTDADEEGPPSEVSDLILVRPGQELTLNTPRADGYSKNRVYQSSNQSQGSDDFLLRGDVNADSCVLLPYGSPQADPLPPFGNYPDVAKETFLAGSKMHPSQFGVAFHEKTLYLSDLYRLWVWPDEYTIPFQDTIKAIAISGNTIIVFAGEKVFGVTGSSPEHMAKAVLSESAPLLADGSGHFLSLCQIGARVFYATYDGVAVVSGSGVEVVTKEHFTRKEWLDYSPSLMDAKTADNSVFLKVSGESDDIRVDFDETLNAITTYSDGALAELTWRSPKKRFEQPTIFDYVKMIAEGAATLNIYADGALAASKNITSGEPVSLIGDVSAAYVWEFEVVSSFKTTRVQAFDRVVYDITDSARFTPENTPLWENMWVKFPEKNQFCALVLSAYGTGTIPVKFYAADGITLKYTAQVDTGNLFPLPRADNRAHTWRISIEQDVHIDSLALLTRRTEAVSELLREVNTGGHPPWRLKRYEFTNQEIPKSLVVHASSYPVTMNIYADGSATATEPPLQISDEGEIRLDWARCSSIDFDFGADDEKVTEVLLFTRKVQPISDNRISLVGRQNWRGNLFSFADRGKPVCGSIMAASYPLSMWLYADGAAEPVAGGVDCVTSGKVFRFARSLAEAALWEIDIAADDAIDSAIFMARQPVPVEGKVLRVTNPRTIPPWLYCRYEFSEQVELVSVRVDADTSVKMRLFLDGVELATETVSLTPGQETLLGTAAKLCSSVEFYFLNAAEDANMDYAVREVGIFAKDEILIGDNGIQMGRRPNWRNLSFKFPDRGSFACGSIGASDYNVILKLNSEPKTVTSGKAFTLPRVSPSNETPLWTVDVNAPGEVHSLILRPRTRAPVQGDVLHLLARDTDMPPWLYSRYELPDRAQFRSVIVHADSYPRTLKLYADGATSYTKAINISGPGEVRLADMGNYSAIDIDFSGYDHAVNEVILFAKKVQPVGDEGISLVDAPSWRGNFFKFPDRGVFACASLGASDYADVTLSLYADSAQNPVYSEAVTAGTIFALPRALAEASLWELDVETDAEVYSVILLPRSRVPVESETFRAVAHDTGVAPWLHSRYEFPDKLELRSVVVHADSYTGLTMNLYVDGATTPTKALSVTSSGEMRITDLGQYSSLDIDFGGDDYKVNELILFAREEQLVGAEGVALQHPRHKRSHFYKFPDRGSFACASVGASSYADLTLRLYADGVKVYESAVADGNVFRLLDSGAPLADAASWELDIETDAEVHSVMLLPWRRVPTEGNALHLVAHDVAIPPWLYSRYEFSQIVKPRSGLVKADSYNSLSFDMYLDGSTTKDASSPTVTDAYEFKCDSVASFTSLVFNFAGDDYLVNEIFLFGEEAVPINNAGFVARNLNGTAPWRNKTLRFTDVGSFSVGRVVASSYSNMTMKLLVGGVEKGSWAVSDSEEFKLTADPVLPNARDWQLDIAHKGEIYEAALISRQNYHTEGNLVVVQAEDEPFSWLDKRIIAARPVNFNCGRIYADSYPVTLKLYTGGTLKHERTISSSEPFRLPRLRPERQWTFDVIAGATVAVYEAVFATSMERIRRLNNKRR